MSNLKEQYTDYFESFKTIIDEFVKIVKAFTDTIKNFVDGFQKKVTKGEDFEDLDDSEL
jgi:hypothetical protein